MRSIATALHLVTPGPSVTASAHAPAPREHGTIPRRVPDGAVGWDAGRLAVLVAVSATVALASAWSERFIYFWDYAVYQTLVTDTAAAFGRSVQEGVALVHASLGEDYNRLFTLPLVPFAHVFTITRPAYITLLALLYQVPLALALAGLTTAAIDGGGRTIFWRTTMLAVLLPGLWAATLRGYPDAGGAALVFIAMLAYIRAAETGALWHAAAAGAAIAVAALFRRHLSYAAVAFYAAVIVHALGSQAAAGPTRAFGARFVSAARLLAAASSASLVVLAAIGWRFVQHTFAVNYYALYTSYQNAPSVELRWFVDFHGAVLWGLAAIGWVLAWRTGALRSGPATFVALFSGISLALWVLVVRQGGPQYPFPVAPLLVTGLVALTRTLWDRSPTSGLRRLALVVVAPPLLIANAVQALGPQPLVRTPLASELFSRRFAPLRRPDYDEFLRLVGYLRGVAGPGQPVFVVGSSEILNDDMLAHADTLTRPPGAPALEVLSTPHVDSRDWPPVEELLRAHVVVVASPLQLHLRPDEQDVVRIAHDVFAGGWEFAQAFARRHDQFSLRDDTTVAVYVRTQRTSTDTAVRFVEAMRRALPSEAFGAPREWTALDEGSAWSVPGQARLPLDTPRSLLYTGSDTWTARPLVMSLRGDAGAPAALRVSAFAAAPDGAVDGLPRATVEVETTSAMPATATLDTGAPDPTRPWLLLVIAPVGRTMTSFVEVSGLSFGPAPKPTP